MTSNIWEQRLGLWWIAEDHPDVPAVVDAPEGPLTYGELAGRAHQVVHTFRALGVGPGGIAEHLATYKRPRRVEFRSELPRTDAGKLYKRQLRDEYWKELGRQI